MGNYFGSSVVTSGLICCLDAANIKSYPGTGTTITDISGSGANGTINGSVAWTTVNSVSYFSFPTQSDSNYISSSLAQNYTDFTILAYLSSTNYGSFNYLLSTGLSTDESIRSSGGSVSNPGIVNDWAYSTATTFYLNGVASTSAVTLPSNGWFILGGAKTNTGSIGSFSYYLGAGYTGRHWTGNIAAVYLYNRQLTAAEQAQNFYALRGRVGL